jgi:hypothetical protein
MPIIGSFGAGSGKGFGFSGGVNNFICATGGTITESGDYRVHTFTGPGTFTVGKAPDPALAVVDYLVVAGGGGAGYFLGGAGGGGGYRESSGTASGCYSASPLGACVSALPVTATAYPITVGAGGAGVDSSPYVGNQGNPSIFLTITSAGGGYGKDLQLQELLVVVADQAVVEVDSNHQELVVQEIHLLQVHLKVIQEEIQTVL